MAATTQIDISKIKSNPNNPRVIKDDKFKKLVQSIKDFPEMLKARPIVVNPDMVVLGGNMRLKALKELGYAKTWVYVADWEEAKNKEFIIKDNVGFGEWDWDMLKVEWNTGDLIEWGMDIAMFPFNKEVKEDDYEMPDDIQTDIVLGDLFAIGPHRLICGDSTDPEQMAILMDGNLSDMIFTDPPYNVDYGANKKHPSWKIRKIENDKQTPQEWEDFCKALFSNFKLFNKGDIYMWGASGPEGMRMRLWLVEYGAHWSATIIWKKQQLVLSPAKYQRIYEPCFYGWFDKSSFAAGRKEVELWEVDRPRESKQHPTMKPIALCAKGIENSSRERDVVLDFFGGSGSTMVAGHQLGRRVYMSEIDPKYCQVIIDRMKLLDPNIEVKKL